MKSRSVPLLSINSCGELRVILLYSMEVSQKVSLLEYFGVIMSQDRGSSHPDCSGRPIDQRIRSG